MTLKDKEWAYYYCPKCIRLAPSAYKQGIVKFCLKCGYIYEKEEGGRKVVLNYEEARLRRLARINPETQEVEDEN